jgi:hypothetical protein
MTTTLMPDYDELLKANQSLKFELDQTRLKVDGLKEHAVRLNQESLERDKVLGDMGGMLKDAKKQYDSLLSKHEILKNNVTKDHKETREELQKATLLLMRHLNTPALSEEYDQLRKETYDFLGLPF